MPERPASAVVPLARDGSPQGGRGGGGPGRRPAVVRVGPRVRPARAVSAAAAVRHAVRRAALLRRGGGGRRGAGAAARGRAALRAADARDRDRRPRRGARRSRRSRARDLRLRIDAAHSADHGGAGRCRRPRRAPGRTGEVSSVAARHVDILPTILDAVGQPVPSDLPGRTLLPRQERRAGAAPRATYFEAMSGMLNHGWAPLTGVLSDRDKLIDLPIAERYDLAGDPAEARTWPAARPSAIGCWRRCWPRSSPCCPASAWRRIRRQPRGCARSGTSPAARQRRRTYTEDDDPKRLMELDSAIHRALDAVGAGRADEAAQIYRQVIERRPGMAIAYRHLALIEWQQGDAARAIGVLRQAVGARRDRRARAVAQLGEYLSDTGQVAEGMRILEPLARSPAPTPTRLNALGHRVRAGGARADARRVFERLLAVLPGSSAPLENLGVLALGAGRRRAGARRYFDRAIARGARLVARPRRSGAAAFRARRPQGGVRGVGAGRRTRPCQSRRAVQPGRQPGARRPDGRRAPVSRSVPANRPARPLRDQRRAVSRLLQANREGR